MNSASRLTRSPSYKWIVAGMAFFAVFAAIGIVIRQRATMDVPADQGVSTVMVSTLLRRRLWWAGTAAAVTGYAFQAGALAYGSLLLVAPLRQEWRLPAPAGFAITPPAP